MKMNLHEFAIEVINVANRRRPIDAAKVDALAMSMQRIGLLNPPTVMVEVDARRLLGGGVAGLPPALDAPEPMKPRMRAIGKAGHQ